MDSCVSAERKESKFSTSALTQSTVENADRCVKCESALRVGKTRFYNSGPNLQSITSTTRQRRGTSSLLLGQNDASKVSQLDRRSVGCGEDPGK